MNFHNLRLDEHGQLVHVVPPVVFSDIGAETPDNREHQDDIQVTFLVHFPHCIDPVDVLKMVYEPLKHDIVDFEHTSYSMVHRHLNLVSKSQLKGLCDVSNDLKKLPFLLGENPVKVLVFIFFQIVL